MRWPFNNKNEDIGLGENKSDIINLFVVTLPSFVVWPGKVILHISYTKTDAWYFIDNYPLRYLAEWMKIEEREIVCYGRNK